MKRLGDAELEIMLHVWSAGEPVPSTYVHQRLQGSRGWSLPAVLTAMGRLVEKGQARQVLFRPDRPETKSFLDFYGG